VDDDLSSRQFLMMSEMLEEAGFIHYEISNFGKKDFFAVHNSNYWLGHYYIGLGPSAHSYNGRERQWNVRSNQLYMQRILSGERFYETETLTPENKYNEYVLTRLRTIWGCNVNEMEKLFGKKFSDHFLQEISAKKNFIIEKNGVFTLNKEGKLLADGIASDLFA
jgi:oxygen-independent coproporphyrinogen-3 oxidase